MKEKVLVTPRSFAKTDPEPLRLLEQAGYQVIQNSSGTILSRDQLREQLADVVGIIVGVDPLDAEILRGAEKLCAIAKYGVGMDNIDLDYARAHGIVVSRTENTNTDAVADFAIALMLAVSRRVVEIDRACHQGDWTKRMGCDFSNRTLGLLGFGAVGRGVAQRARGFHAKVLAYDPFWDAEAADRYDVEYALPERIYREADFISLHLPLTPETQGMIGAEALSLMKPTVVLVNTARGGIVDEGALADALREKRILGAGIDVFAQEPPQDPALYQLENLIMGSHCAASTTGAAEAMSHMAAMNLLDSLRARSRVCE